MNNQPSEPKVALVYDRVNTPFGGAENVLLALHQIYPEAPLYTSVYDAKTAPWAKVFKVHPSFLQRIPFAKKFHRLFAVLMPLAFESFDLSKFDIVVSVTSAEAKGVLTKPSQLHICYLLTPTRYLWSHAAEYEQDRLTGWLRKIVFAYLKWWDEAAALRPDIIIPISQLVAGRCQKFYHRTPVSVIYPTVMPTLKLQEEAISTNAVAVEIRPFLNKYFLVVSRLVPYKRIDLAIQACQKAQKPLVVIGQGPDLSRLKKLAEHSKIGNPNAKVFFLQAVQPAQIWAYYRHCRAFLAPAEEDFGMTVLEAQQFGKPVVVYAKSGAAEVVEEGLSGIHFAVHAVEDMSEAVNLVDSFTWEESAIRNSVKQYTPVNFQQQFQTAVEYYWRQLNQKGLYAES